MPKVAESLFDPKLFLARVGESFSKNQIVFAQGDAADTVFYIQKGRIKVLVASEQGKEAVVGIMNLGSSLAKDASMVIRCGLRQRWPWKNA